MNWNYRIIKRTMNSEQTYSIHEVYYAVDGAITSWTKDPMHANGESIHELRNDVTWFWGAFQKPVLTEVKDDSGGEQLIEEVDAPEINAGHVFEVMDRSSVAMSHFDDFVGSHPVVRKDPSLKKRADAITEMMYELYSELAKLGIAEKSQ